MTRLPSGGAPRVLVVANSLRPGGVETTLALAAPRLQREGLALHLALWEARGPVRGALPPGLPVTAFGRPATLARVPGFAWWLRRLILRVRPDVVWALHPRNIAPCVVATLALPDPPGVVGTIVGEFSAGRLGPARRWVTRHLDAVVSVTGETGSRFRQEMRYAGPARVIGNGVDAAAVRAAGAAPCEHPWAEEGGPLAVTVARLAPGKGVDTVLEAVARVRERVPLRLIVVGDGPERAACEALADGLGVARAVSFVGARSAPLPLVAAADVFVFGSVSETMPFALLEAMALGVPVVSTAYAGGWAELLRPGENSLVAPPGDVAALADCIVRVLEEPGLAGRLTAGAGDDVARRSADAMASSYASVLREVAAG